MERLWFVVLLLAGCAAMPMVSAQQHAPDALTLAPPLPGIEDAVPSPSLPLKATSSQGPHPSSGRMNLHVDRAPLREVLQGFAQFAGMDIVTSDGVKGEVSMHVIDVRWQDAFAALLRSRGLARQDAHGVMWVAPAAEIEKRARDQDDALAKQADNAPLASRLFELHYQRADDMRKLIAGDGQLLLSKRGALSADMRTNRLFVTDTPARLAHIAELVTAFDLPARQVLIEARIVEADAGFSQQLGARLRLGGGAKTDAVQIPGGTLYDAGALPLLGVTAASAAFTLFKAGADRLISLELSALESEGRGKVLSSPRVVTTDRHKATIEQGTELPYQGRRASRRGDDSGGARSGSVQFKRASLRLEVTPHITPDRRVLLEVDVAKDTLGVVTDAGHAIDTKQVRTQVEVEDGGTVSIGGIFSRETRRDVVGVPLLQRIPFLGALFRRTTETERKIELVILLTPTVVDADITRFSVPGAKRASVQDEADVPV
ncbi:type IV pilus secretin PilQ [Robbsia andropogonis]|uniref:type IV pilus secretin PilQ n=1 Tax=Robbsia andropogonis TaxID=28092 RepID=UPI0004B222BB|nr:type IV pilus secretin PilQ [Robbsia andropogonis]MCP1120552.1 type IV pilus secretin PilQ [Robbsia andropogonis]MCP1130513.1 type IV pilus secretin PilQ [Robbsia andropogonis]